MGGGGGNSGGGRGYCPNKDGYYGRKGQSKSNCRVRNMPGGSDGAKNFFENISHGFVNETNYPNGTIRRVLPDSTSITYRNYSSSDGTSVVEIRNGNRMKDQKIHFIEQED